MNLEGIINVSGKQGLYKIISKSKNSIIIESLIDKKRIPIYSQNNINSLEDIGIYTHEDTVPLLDVFKNIAIKENYKKCISSKSLKNELEDYFRNIIPEYDEDRVYMSDIKKVFQWYNLLQDAGLIKISKSKKKENE